jgi:hypothetical protein
MASRADVKCSRSASLNRDQFVQTLSQLAYDSNRRMLVFVVPNKKVRGSLMKRYWGPISAYSA